MNLVSTVMLGRVAPAIPEGYLSIDKAVEETGISRETLFRWIKIRRIGGYRVGGIRNTLVKRAELDAELGPQRK